MLSASQFGSRLQAARKQRGLSREAVADELGLSCAEVASWESGRREASMPQITRLGEIYQCSPLFFFRTDEKLDQEDLPAVVDRELSDLDLTLEIKIGLWRLFRLFGEGLDLRERLKQRGELIVFKYNAQRENASDWVFQGEDAARRARFQLELQRNKPIPRHERITKVAERIGDYGIWTAAADLPKGLSGLLVDHPHVGLAVLVSREYQYRHRRFFYSRALAHAIFDLSGRTVVAMRQKGSFDCGEIRANAFAAEFLMPEEGVRKRIEKIFAKNQSSRMHMGVNSADSAHVEENINLRSISQAVARSKVIDLADHFCVSYELALERLERLGYIRPRQKEAFAEKGKFSETSTQLPHGQLKIPAKTETGERELRDQLMKLAKKAFSEKKISCGRLIKIARELKVNGRELYEYIENSSTD